MRAIKTQKAEKSSKEKIPFKVSARAGKLLGRENFSNPEGAIIELVKNSYDADAKNCLVIFDIRYQIDKDENGTTRKTFLNDQSNILVIDNGEGMTLQVIKDLWMQIGTGNKEYNFLSAKKRIKTGAKGIGRFALDRLGFTTEMWTKKEKVGYKWEMDWNQFDNGDQLISDITAEITEENFDIETYLNDNFNLKNLNGISFKTGTILKISNLKDTWSDDNIQNVFKSLEALIPPKELNIQFSVNFFHLQQPKEYGIVETAFFNDYDYKLIANYDADELKVNFEITRNEIDLETVKKKYAFLYKNLKAPYDLKTLVKKTFKYSKSIDEILRWDLDVENTKQLKDLGNFNLTFYYLKFATSLKEAYPYKTINQKERRSVLDKFGGVKIYRDSFRVRPYGDPDNDWLKLGARVAQSPAGAGQRVGDWRVRPEQTAGIITISRKDNPFLIDKSDRGALQENETYEIFRNIIIKVIHEFEVDRSKILNVYYKHFSIEKEKEKEKEIQRRAEILANEILAKRKEVEKKIYGSKKDQIDLFQEKKEEEEKKTYEKAFKDTFDAIENERIEKDNEEIVQVRGLASLGLIVSSFSHELKEVKNNVDDIEDLEVIYEQLVPEAIKKEKIFFDGKNIIDSLKADTKKITHWIEYSLNAIKKDKRKRTNLDIGEYFESLSTNWKSVLEDRSIQLAINNKSDDKILLKSFEMDMNTIFSNLISNSIDSFQNLKSIKPRIIKITLKEELDFIEIDYMDNGTGLSTVFLNDKESIFQPFTTSKKDKNGNDIGTGLGMYLVKSVIEDYNGNILIFDSLEGFHVKISLPNTRKQK